MTHPLDRPIASDSSYLVLEQRRERGELQTSVLHRRDQSRDAIPALVAHRRRFTLESDELGTDAPYPNPVGRAVGEEE